MTSETPAIRFYDPREDHGYLANYFAAEFELEGRSWSTVEHYYQAQKFFGLPEIMRRITNARTPDESKSIARLEKAHIRSDWDDIRESIMYRAISAKFRQHPVLAGLLMQTGDADIIEAAPDDAYWGSGAKGMGQNRMGSLLMRLRRELRIEVSDALGDTHQRGRK